LAGLVQFQDRGPPVALAALSDVVDETGAGRRSTQSCPLIRPARWCGRPSRHEGSNRRRRARRAAPLGLDPSVQGIKPGSQARHLQSRTGSQEAFAAW